MRSACCSSARTAEGPPHVRHARHPAQRASPACRGARAGGCRRSGRRTCCSARSSSCSRCSACSRWCFRCTWRSRPGSRPAAWTRCSSSAWTTSPSRCSDDWFWKSLKNTAWLALASGVPQHLVAIPLACFIHASFKRAAQRRGRGLLPALHHLDGGHRDPVQLAVLHRLRPDQSGHRRAGAAAGPGRAAARRADGLAQRPRPHQAGDRHAGLLALRRLQRRALPGRAADDPEGPVRGRHDGRRRPAAAVLLHHAAAA